MGSRPPRRPRSCAPPTSIGSNRLPRRTTSAPGPGRAAELVRADAHEVCVERAEIRRHVPARGGRVDVDGHAGLAAQRDHLVDGLQRADLVVGPLAVDEGRARQRRRLESCAQGFDVESARFRPRGSVSTGAERAEASRTAECSTAAQSTGAPGQARQAPHTAALIASVAPDVKTTWRGTAPSSTATSLACLLQRVAHDAALFVQPAWIARRQRGPTR